MLNRAMFAGVLVLVLLSGVANCVACPEGTFEETVISLSKRLVALEAEFVLLAPKIEPMPPCPTTELFKRARAVHVRAVRVIEYHGWNYWLDCAVFVEQAEHYIKVIKEQNPDLQSKR